MLDTGIRMRMGDIADRWSILRMKIRFDKKLIPEFKKYDEVINKLFDFKKGLSDLADLIEANAKIWVLEAAIRKEFKDDILSHDKLSAEQIGFRILEIRPYNKRRLEAKDRIDIYYGNVPDKKYFENEFDCEEVRKQYKNKKGLGL